ncbi:hypothetical protein HHL17_15620 [Chitinophaga sp. G-6-1-13]|uniref:DUF6265 domain-containing protein n=1 Tax=Chitinophaga fulva TaxID=2728842 RepID=A0A848GL40_9BACT|nr:DUF6265 family protein [Chitinophaga fulva]NML38637.1 hypothetical protein [Chitinophaga fulva]
MAKKLWWSNSMVLLLLLAGGLSAAAQVRPADFRMLDKLAGTWKMRTKLGAVVETWSRTNDSTWTGRTWRVAGADSTLQQSVELVRRGNEIFFIPVYEGRTATTPIRLKLRVLKEIGFVAEDLANDFPRKVTYRFKDAEHLDARVEGKRDGTTEEYIFPYQRAD